MVSCDMVGAWCFKFFSFHMDYSDSDVTLPEGHIVKRKDMKLFCFFFGIFIAGVKSATVVVALIS